MSKKPQKKVNFGLNLYDWQQKFLEEKGNICVRSGRQVGKSTVVSLKASIYAATHARKNVLIIASVERQAYLLFEKVLAYMEQNYRKLIRKGRHRPTKSKLELTNGSRIYCLPTGLTGHGIRGYTIDLLIADEAAFIPEAVWDAVTPMLAATKGQTILVSTPHGKEGFYYNCFSDPTYTSFHISSEDCPHLSKDYLQREKERKTALVYAQEYLGEFISELRQVFPDDLIQKCCVLQRRLTPKVNRKLYLGCDIAGMGKDETTFEIVDITHKTAIEHIDHQITKKQYPHQTAERILGLNAIHNFHKIYIDDGGLGVGVFGALLKATPTKRKVVGINNARRVYERDNKGRELKFREKKFQKEELYNNLLNLMEKGHIKLLDDEDIALSLKSIQFEIAGKLDVNGEPTGKTEVRYFGNYTHIAEGLIRAAWGVTDKTLNMYKY